MIRVQVLNSGNKEVTVPLLNLEDDNGNNYLELSDGQGVEEWWGVLRTLSPSETQNRRVLFDVRPMNHKLRVTDGGEPDKEQTALVTIPLKLKDAAPLTPDAPITAPTAAPQPGSQQP